MPSARDKNPCVAKVGQVVMVNTTDIVVVYGLATIFVFYAVTVLGAHVLMI